FLTFHNNDTTPAPEPHKVRVHWSPGHVLQTIGGSAPKARGVNRRDYRRTTGNAVMAGVATSRTGPHAGKPAGAAAGRARGGSCCRGASAGPLVIRATPGRGQPAVAGSRGRDHVSRRPRRGIS